MGCLVDELPSWASTSAMESVATMTASSMLMQLACGSFMPAEIFIPASGLIAGGLTAYRLMTHQ
jgi:hypothetical protein